MILKSVYKLEIGACGAAGVMGTTLTDYREKLASGGIEIAEGDPSITTVINDGGVAPIVAIPGSQDGLTLSFSLNDFSADELAEFKGGSVDETSGDYSAPTSRVLLERSVQITGDAVNDTRTILQIPRAFIMAAIKGKATSDAEDLVYLSIKATALIPLDANGDYLAPYVWSTEDVS